MTTKIKELVLRATLDDQVSAQADKIDNRLRSVAQTASRVGRIGGIQGFGTVNQLVQLGTAGGSLARGGLAAGGLFLADRAAAGLASRLESFNLAVAEGDDAMGRIRRTFLEALPVISTGINLGRQLGQFLTAFTGEGSLAKIGRQGQGRREVAERAGFKTVQAAGALDAFLRPVKTQTEQLTTLIESARESLKADGVSLANMIDVRRAIDAAQDRINADVIAKRRKLELEQADAALQQTLALGAERRQLEIDALKASGNDLAARMAEIEATIEQRRQSILSANIDTSTDAGRAAQAEQDKRLLLLDEQRAALRDQVMREDEKRINDDFMRLESERMRIEEDIAESSRRRIERQSDESTRLMVNYRGEDVSFGPGQRNASPEADLVRSIGRQIEAQRQAADQAREQTRLQQRLAQNVDELLRLMTTAPAI